MQPFLLVDDDPHTRVRAKIDGDQRKRLARLDAVERHDQPRLAAGVSERGDRHDECCHEQCAQPGKARHGRANDRQWHDGAVRRLEAPLLALTFAGGAAAHGGGSHTGFVATVSQVEPPQLGLLVQVVGGHERLALRNLTPKTVVIFGQDGQPALRLAPGESGSVADPRIGSTGPPPEQGEFVRDWRIPGEADGEPFEIVGFLGYRPPPGEARDPESDGSGFPVWAIALTVGLGVIVVAATLALPLRRREGES
jgi:hypothetical protein